MAVSRGFSKAAGAPPPWAVKDVSSTLDLPPGPPPPGPPPDFLQAEMPPPPPDFDLDLASLGGLPPPPPGDEFPGFGQFSVPPGPPEHPPPDIGSHIGGLPGFPPGFPPGFMPAGMPFALPGNGPEPAFGPDPLHPDTVKAKAAPTAPPQDKEAAKKKRKTGVDGLASAKHIKSGGSVTVYSDPSGTLAGPHAPQVARQTSAPSSDAKPNSQGTEALPRQLPEGWEMKRSRTTGRIYYLNEKLGKSQFEPPAGSTIKTETRKKSSHRPKDSVDAQLSDRNGVQGLVRANEKRVGRWQKWQQCNKVLNEPAEGEGEEP